MAIKKSFKILTLILLTISLGVFWENAFLMPLKLLVVYLHEISHAIGTVLTGGQVQVIAVNLDESGFTQTTGGNFLAIAGAGYFGSIIFGSIMLHSGLSGKFVRTVSWGVGLLITCFTIFIPQKIPLLVLIAGISWGGIFIATVLMFHHINRSLLFFMGGLTSLYSVYDLLDFFRGNIFATDAGLIARHFIRNEQNQVVVAYAIAIGISVISIWVLYRVTFHAINMEKTDNEPIETEETVHPVENLPPEAFELLAKIQMAQQSQQSNNK